MAEHGILAYGAYVPRLRLQRSAAIAANGWFNPALKAQGKGERSMAYWDEDAITMAVEAARDCMIGRSRDEIKALHMASTSFPFDDRQNSGVVATALDLPAAIDSLDLAGSLRAGTSGLLNALTGAAASGGPILFVASEHRRAKPGSFQEIVFGDAAVAVLVGEGKPIARLIGRHSETVDFVDHYRGHGRPFDYAWEERWVRDEGYMKLVPAAIAAALSSAGVALGEVTHFCLPGTTAKLAQAVARMAGLREACVRDNLAGVMGDSGAAHPLVMLVHMLEQAKPGERILVVGFGQGCNALLFEATEELPLLSARRGVTGALRRRREETNYGKYLAFNDLIPLDRGMRSELDKATPLSSLYRNREMVLGMVGGRCTNCGTLQFPKSDICVNPNCHAIDTQERHRFADMHGSVMSFTADHLTYTPDPPLHYGMVTFSEGGRIWIDFTDVDPGEVAVGTPMRMAFRIKDHDSARGFVRYFWKATPVGDAR